MTSCVGPKLSRIFLSLPPLKVGAGEEPEPDREANQDMVPESEDEVKEEHTATGDFSNIMSIEKQIYSTDKSPGSTINMAFIVIFMPLTPAPGKPGCEQLWLWERV